MAVVVQRPLRGSRISSFYPVKNLPSLSSLDSAFQLQEYISLLIRLDVHDVDTIVSVPGKTNGKEKNENESGEELKGEEKEHKSEIAVDEACWIYEQLRRLAQDLSHPLITMLQQECTRASCHVHYSANNNLFGAALGDWTRTWESCYTCVLSIYSGFY